MKEDGLTKLLTQDVSADRILDNVAWITRFHRMQATSDMLKAAEFAVETFERYGLKSELVRIPIGDWVGGVSGFDGWDCDEASLSLVEPQEMKLADWEDNRLSLIQRSAPIDGVFEVVDVTAEDVRGKFLITDKIEDVRNVHEYISRGIAGIIFYGIGKNSIDLPGARRYLSFWWTKGYRNKIPGFVLNYRQGVYLKALISRHGNVKVRARVKSRFYDGTLDIATAVIEGESPREIVLTAHLCHPKNEANDNASGSAVVLEVARVLNALIKGGKIKRPELSIRFLLVPEIFGTNAFYLSNPELAQRGIMGLNFDMVGTNLALSGGAMVVDRQPAVAKGYASALAARLRRKFVSKLASWFEGGSIDGVPVIVKPFSGGSDHFVLSDPYFDIPSPTLINWPDKYYHTDYDTIDKLSAGSLRAAAHTGVVFAFMTANPNKDNLRCAADSVLIDTIEDVQRILREELDRLDLGSSSSTRFMAMLKRIAQQGYENLSVVRRNGFDTAGHEALISNYITDIIKVYEERFDRDVQFFDKSLYPNDKTPVRKTKGSYWPWSWLRENRPDLMKKWNELAAKAADAEGFMKVPEFTYLWFDGNKNTREVAFDIASVYGMPPHPEQYAFYLEILTEIGFIELK